MDSNDSMNGSRTATQVTGKPLPKPLPRVTTSGVTPDVVTLGKGFGNGFPVTCVAVREPFMESFESISASSSYGGNPMACAAALASTEVIIEEKLLENAQHLGEVALKRMERMKQEHRII